MVIIINNFNIYWVFIILKIFGKYLCKFFLLIFIRSYFIDEEIEG